VNESKTTVANGQISTMNKLATITIQFDAVDYKIQGKLYILKHLPEKKLIGNKFLIDYEIKIDYKNHALKIGNKNLPMHGRNVI
jgi:hypothetical protein